MSLSKFIKYSRIEKSPDQIIHLRTYFCFYYIMILNTTQHDDNNFKNIITITQRIHNSYYSHACCILSVTVGHRIMRISILTKK